MDLTGRGVWDLSAEEVEWAYRNLQLNNYLYAALRMARSSRPPLGRVVKLRPAAVPSTLRAECGELAALSAYLGNADPRVVRVNSVHHAFRLLAKLSTVRAAELPAALEVLACLAYIPVLAEKNDGFPLWHSSVVRPADARIRGVFSRLLAGEDFRLYPPASLIGAPRPEPLPDESAEPLLYALMLVPRLAQCIIIMDENASDPDDVGRAWSNLEAQVLRFEREHGLEGGDSPGGPGAQAGGPAHVRDANQIRYRNTLYLYGGDFLRRRQRFAEAWDWYTSGILFGDLPSYFGLYLTDMKTTERLLCASALRLDPRRDGNVRELIPHCIDRAFAHASDYAQKLLAAILRNPGLDLGLGRLEMEGRPWLYCGEASREPFLFSLLWWHLFQGQPLEAIPYEKYLVF